MKLIKWEKNNKFKNKQFNKIQKIISNYKVKRFLNIFDLNFIKKNKKKLKIFQKNRFNFFFKFAIMLGDQIH